MSSLHLVISNVDALLFVLILEVALLQIQILERSAFRRAQQLSALNKKKQLQRDKFTRDRILVKDVIRQTLVEVAEDGQTLTLHNTMDISSQSSSTIASMQINNDDLKTLLENTKHELMTKRYDWSFQLREFDEKVASLKDEIKDSCINAKARLCYAEKWLCAAVEALELRFQTVPSSLPRQDHEKRVHTELARAYEYQIKERNEMLDVWKIKYREDTTMLKDKVIEQREKLRLTTGRREELQNLYDYHAGEMRAWLTFKKERAARLAREERSRAAATRIQSWWRGLMVRRALGAFRHLRNAKKGLVKNKKK